MSITTILSPVGELKITIIDPYIIGGVLTLNEETIKYIQPAPKDFNAAQSNICCVNYISGYINCEGFHLDCLRQTRKEFEKNIWRVYFRKSFFGEKDVERIELLYDDLRKWVDSLVTNKKLYTLHNSF